MANVVSGNTVSSSAQLNTGVVDANAIATDAVQNAEIKDGEVRTQEILDGTIVDADISASAAIADTKLAQITTASKVSGAALTSLASIPAGAGVIPSANLPAVGARITSDATDQTVGNVGNGVSTTLYTLSVPGGTLSTGNTIFGRIYISSEGWTTNGTNQVTVTYGSTVILTFSIAGATMTTGFLDFEITANGATNSQYASGMTAWPTIGYVMGSASEDSTTTKNLLIKYIPSATNPGDTVTFGGVTLNKYA